MVEQSKTGEPALVRAVRALDQGDVETIPNKLERIWDVLSDYRGGSFHAAEEMLLRWLLKQMTGNSAAAERVRRYSRVWDILAAVFSLIPLFSLAKSLADRRFLAIVQQTLKDVATPERQERETNEAGSDVEMADAPPLDSPESPRKRKRANPASFDISVQRQTAGCLETADAVFNAIRTLISRCEHKSLDSAPIHRMGAEHVKSLFWSSASDAMGILAPWLTVCGFALDGAAGPFREQSSWLSTFAAMWELHLRGSGDASEVATHLSGPATRLLGRLSGVARQVPLGIDATVQGQWSRDLRRFMTRNLILPARAAFLTKGSQEVVKIAVEMASPSAQITFPVLFDLVTRSPLELGSKTSRKDFETWVQAVFDSMLHASKNLNRDSSLYAVRAIMGMAAERGTALSASSLRTVCKSYALRRDVVDWNLLLSIMKLNPDVFLISEDGQQLLDQVLEKTREPEAFAAEDFGRAAEFILLLAEGYAQGRDLSTFFKVWLRHLVPVKPKGDLQSLWAQRELIGTVARLIQSSLNTNQLAQILEWLSSQTGAGEAAARAHILDAISTGISQEEFVDAANMTVFDGVFVDKFSKTELPAVSACRWAVACKTISRASLEETARIWLRIKGDIKSILRKYPVNRQDTFAAFRCCVAAWLANHSGATHEDEAGSLICAFIDRLENDSESMESDSPGIDKPVNRETYLNWMLSDAPRLLSLFVERKGSIPSAIMSLVAGVEDGDAARLDSALVSSRLLLERESNINNQKLMDLLIDAVITMIDTSKAGRSGPKTKIAIQFLLGVPIEALTRSQREATMKSLVAHLPQDSDKSEAIGTEYWQPILSLMVKMMGRPTFYDNMTFSHLNSIGRCLLKLLRRSNRRSREGLPADDISKDRHSFSLLRQLATLTIRQMTGGNLEDREKAYLTGAVSLLRSPCKDSDVVLRILLLQAFIAAVQTSAAAKKLEGEGIDLNGLKEVLLELAPPLVTSGKRNGKWLLELLTALEALSDLDGEVLRKTLSGAVPSLLEMGDSLLENGAQEGWEIRRFLVNHFPDAIASPLKVKMSPEGLKTAGEVVEADVDASGGALGKMALLRYVDSVVQVVDDSRKLGYLNELLLEDQGDRDTLGRLLVIYRIIQHLKGSPPLESPDQFGLAQAHTMLCDRARKTTSLPRFVLITKIIRLLLDQNPVCMTQWNIDCTLSTVSAISSRAASTGPSLFASSPSTYQSLCRLMEILIKRHRKRLDGHFHLLVSTLQSLLRLLLSRPPSSQHGGHGQQQPTSTITTTTNPLWETNARHFTRLLTLICEPTVSSVTRSSSSAAAGGQAGSGGGGGDGGGPLDSEKDRARRYAGQHMYLVLMQYIKLQLEQQQLPANSNNHNNTDRGGLVVIPHGVRETLETTGMYSVLDVTSSDVLKVMNDGLDASGRVVFRELYRRWQRFGKWSGV